VQRHRRLVLTDRLIPFLAAFVGLIALGGAVMVQVNADARTQRMAEEMAELRQSIDELGERQAQSATATPAQVIDQRTLDAASETAEALQALEELQARLAKLEEEVASAPAVAAAGPQLPGTPASGSFAVRSDDATGAIDPSWPTENCIPLGTRFMASVGDELAICESPVVIRVRAITGDNVMMDDIGLITETAFKPIPGSNCQLTVFTADAEGFAEMRVSCV
jgi:hypothetical protein